KKLSLPRSLDSRNKFLDGKHFLLAKPEQIDTENAGKTWQVLDVTTGKVVREINFPASPSNISPDGRYAAISKTEKDGSTALIIHDSQTGKSFTALKNVGDVSTTFAPDGIYLWNRYSSDKSTAQNIHVYKLPLSAGDSAVATKVFSFNTGGEPIQP